MLRLDSVQNLSVQLQAVSEIWLKQVFDPTRRARHLRNKFFYILDQTIRVRGIKTLPSR